ncbi:hypothetical protein AB833_24850 [Chromatiales bacterium (ex Bugula neritina AB1)]|nr:hypothetical protein AB833_24850 [Chromatiales bacterium (ex Bugula neritina AB1)]
MFAQALREHAESHPHRVAIEWKNEKLTWLELSDRVGKVARHFKKLGVENGSTVALVLPNTPDFITTFLAGAVSGATILPVNPQFKVGELSFLFEQCRVSVVVVPEQRLADYQETIDALDWPVEVVVSADYAVEGVTSFSTLFAADEARCPIAADGETTFVYQYSSGSTGLPKRVSRTHDMCWAEAENISSSLNLTTDDTILCAVPLFHTYGMGNCFFAFLKSGARLILLNQPGPFVLHCSECLRLLEQSKATFFPAVPYMYQIMADSGKEADLSSLRYAISSGTPLQRSTYEQFCNKFGVRLRQLYGCTEAGCVAINIHLDPDENCDSVGSAINGVNVKLVDANREEVAPGEKGEVVIQTSALTKEYYQQDDLNARVFDGGCFYTGDIGYNNSAGGLVLVGRKTAYIEVAGNKVNPEEIEEVIIQHALVEEVVVVGLQPTDSYNCTVKAVVVVSKDCSESEIISFCRSRLAPFKVPSEVEFREELPRSPLGKILKKYLV